MPGDHCRATLVLTCFGFHTRREAVSLAGTNGCCDIGDAREGTCCRAIAVQRRGTMQRVKKQMAATTALDQMKMVDGVAQRRGSVM